jgi:hypothetical protein
MNHETHKDDFYIGYLPKTPKVYAKMAIIAIGIISIVLATAGVTNGIFQNEFNPGYFEFGELTTVKGVLYKTPVTRLEVSNGDAPSSSIILVGSGKMGALGTIEAMENRLGDVIDGREVELQGTLIYGEGKVLLELTAHEESLILAHNNWSDQSPIRDIESVGLHGEIVDPKCYFGVMKPGNGKTHRACAIRCVSGGIPPVLRVAQSSGPPKFYLLRGSKGERINKELLDYIAHEVYIKGKHTVIDDWDMIDIDVDSEDALSIVRVNRVFGK